MNTAVFLCRCGPHISDYIDLEQIRQRLPHYRPQVVVHDIDFICADDGKDELRKTLARSSPERIVVAACSPCDHQKTFAALLEDAGINPGFLQMANIREQVAWVTPDIERSTEKALRTVLAAVDRVRLHEPLQKRIVTVCTDVLVIGSGPAGLTAAHTLATAGRHVILVERRASLGGKAVLQDRLEPSGECGACLINPLASDVLEDVRCGTIDLLAKAEVENCRGFFGNFSVTVRQTGLQIDSCKCIGCAACIVSCPVIAPDGHRAVDMDFPGSLPNVPVISRELCRRYHGEDCTVCSDACPLDAGCIDFDRVEREVELKVGGIVVGVGADDNDISLVARRIGIPTDDSGKFMAARSGLDPVRSPLKGIYLAGACSGGYGVGLATLQGLAAAGAALSDLHPDGVVELDNPVAQVITHRCSGCRICIGLCPYQAIALDARGRCVINDVLCRGCGACSSVCPSGAIRLQQYTHEQLMAEMKVLLDRDPA